MSIVLKQFNMKHSEGDRQISCFNQMIRT